MSDQVIRLYHIINLLPSHAEKSLTIPVLKNKLLDKGYDVSIRTLQRDMNALESIFAGIDSSKRTDRRICWFWQDELPINVSKLRQKLL
jgi:predicted DNA-binding transcriptional regulator YafY